MRIFLTLDYELFSGSNPGSVEKTILLPTRKLLEVGERYGAKFVFFVDSGYLVRLAEYVKRYPAVAADYDAVRSQIEKLYEEGHDIQLHIHPHWEDCTYDENGWHMDTSRFRIHAFSEDEIDDIVCRYKKVLTDIVGDTVFAYRAGGWCLQPFEKLGPALKKHGIWLDSTVYSEGLNSSQTHFYDFRGMPEKSAYRFENDPVKEDPSGYFLEVPISTYRVSPLFFWRFAWTKKFGKNEHKVFADGIGAGGTSNASMLRMLTRPTRSLVSMDGLRASLLTPALKANSRKDPDGNFVVIGHPKAVTPYSLDALDRFLRNLPDCDAVTTFGDWVKSGDISEKMKIKDRINFLR